MPNSYLKTYEQQSFTNLDALRCALNCLHNDTYSVSIPKRGYEIDALIRTAPVGALSMHYVHYGAGVPINLTAEKDASDHLMLCLLTSGGARLRQGSTELEVDGTKALIRDEREFITSEQVDFGCLFLAIPIPRLRSHLRALLGERADTIAPAFTPVVDLAPPAIQHLQNTVHFVARELEGPLKEFDAGMLLGDLETLLLNQFVHALPNAHSDVLRVGSFPAAVPYHIKRAREYIHAHAGERILLEDLANHAGCSIRTLQAAFRDSLGATPSAYIKSVRLDGIRRALLDAAPGSSVAEIAINWGFAHHGNFSRGYREKFGVSPSETLRRKK